VHGDIDLSNAEQLEQEISTLGAGDTTGIVVDLAEVTFLDSAGINALVKSRRWADGHGRSMWVTGARGLVREVLVLTGVLAHLSPPPR
jgi:anti-anti-sigma factor